MVPAKSTFIRSHSTAVLAGLYGGKKSLQMSRELRRWINAKKPHPIVVRARGLTRRYKIRNPTQLLLDMARQKLERLQMPERFEDFEFLRTSLAQNMAALRAAAQTHQGNRFHLLQKEHQHLVRQLNQLLSELKL